MRWPGRLEAGSTLSAPIAQQWPGVPESKPQAERAKQPAPGLRAGDTLDNPAATDGDTLRADNGRVRLWGADAPERDQEGYRLDASGNRVAVPIGAQSQSYLAGQLTGPATFGNPQAPSYGRNVGTVTAGGNDLALGSLRSGNATAAPQYMRDDPARSFEYSQAERLARLNSLGVHAVAAQSPADHRRNPDWQPSREALDATRDGPPLQGLSPDAERQFYTLFLDPRTETPTLVAFARKNGWQVDTETLARVRNVYARTGELPSRDYMGAALTRRDDNAGGLASYVRTAADALTGTFGAELAAVPNALGLTDGRENVFNSERSFGEIWQNNRDQNEAVLAADSEAVYPDWDGRNAWNSHKVRGQELETLGLGSENKYIPPNPQYKAEIDGFTEAWLRDPNRDVETLVDVSIATAEKYGVVPASREAVRAGIIEHFVEPLARGEQVLSMGLVGYEEPASLWDRIHGSAANSWGGTVGIAAGNVWSAGYLDEIAGGVRSVVNGTDYETERDRMDFAKQDSFRRNPGAAFLGEIGAGVTGAAALAKFAPAAASAVASRPILSGALGGAVYGSGENNANRIEGTIEGAIGGTVAGVGGKYVLEPLVRRAARSEGAQMARNAARGMFGKLRRSAPVEEAAPAPNSAPVLAGLPGGPAIPPRARTIAMEAEPDEAATQAWPGAPERAQRLLDPLTPAQLRASAARIMPQDVLPLPSNVVADAEELAASQAGRFGEVKIPNEREQLTRGRVRGMNGDVPKVGPVDLVGWVRLNGGLVDSGDAVSKGGDLKAMGLNNAARRGMDFIGQEARFGPLITDEGMSLDDAALMAWEAGYFPELDERPSVNEFLDAISETYNGGSGRRFHPDDFPEIENYYSQQAERYAVEKQRWETGQPVYEDRSVPAEEGQPFPPVAAYEDWGPNPPDFAGNVRLEKLESPQDISRALSITEREVGFDAATRGRVSQAETERLAAELNMRPDDLLKRRKGQALNAEEALAARQILAKSGNELVNAAKRMRALGEDPGSEAMADFREKWLRHVAIQEQVSGMTAEAGRALQQFRMAANSRAVRGEVLTAMSRAGGGRGDLSEAADILIEAAEVSPGVFNELAMKAQKPRWRNKIGELYINMLLSNPPTHVVNSVSNTLTSIAQVPEHAVGAALGKVRQLASRGVVEDRIYSSEVGARAFGLVEGTKEGARAFAQALRTGEASDMVSKVEGDEFKAISGLKGEIIRIPTRLLTAEDEFFKGMARRMEINALAANTARREGLKGDAFKARVADLSQNPTDEMLERASDYGRYLTFQRQLGEFGRGVSQITSASLPAKIIVPFVRTPINLLKFATERSPAAPLLKEWRQDFRAGGARRDMAVARALVGTGFAATIYEAAKNGTITGGLPPDEGKARLLRADGWQPYSIKIGDRYVSYSRLDPFATTIGVAADMATLPQNLSEKQQNDQATMLVASIMANLASKTWLSGVSGLVEALDDPQRYADGWMQRIAGSFAVPAGVAGMARQMDPVAREREGLLDAVKARTPGLSDNLRPRRDVFGEPVELDSLGPDFLSPFWQSKEKNDPVIAEMLRIGRPLGPPAKQYTEDGEKLDFDAAQYDRYEEISGRLIYNGLTSLFAAPDYEGLSQRDQRKRAGDVIRRARSAARGVLNDPGYQLPEKGAPVSFSDGKPQFDTGAKSSDGEQWPGQPEKPRASSESWPGQPVANRDVVGKLKRAIPGVGMTSGYRSEEYQADMRRRGYNPASNSRHLDGSSLDLKPPPGKSMRWLMDQVQKVEPGAYMLDEGDHLHVTFPDWFGAPALGGAKSAGLRNPLEARQ